MAERVVKIVELGESFKLVKDVAKEDVFNAFVLCAGGNIETDITLAGEGTQANVNILYLGAAEENLAITARVTHTASKTKSEQVIRGIMTGKANADFAGLIKVGKNIEAIVGNQQHKAVLLSNEAKVSASPELDMECEDVKCTHGSSIGEIGEEALFYMRTRGLAKDEARRLLLAALAKQVFEGISDDTEREIFNKRIEEWLMTNIK